MRLIHYSKTPVNALRPVSPDVEPNGKPVGLWVSVEGESDWKEWCEAEQFHLDALAFAHEVTLKPDAKILIVPTAFDLDVFTEAFSKPCEWSSSRREIDWLGVAELYQGIVIAPYQWSRRLAEHTFWYYGWDCASGCIWDINAIDALTVVSVDAHAEEER
jgi:hypothetical protein